MKPATLLTNNTLTVVVEGQTLTMRDDHPNWNNALEALRQEQYESLVTLFDVEKAVPEFTEGNISVANGQVYYKDELVHNHVVERLIDFMSKNLPYKPLVRFIDKLMSNPSRRATNELYAFLEHKNMPLTPDGNFLAYKGVQSDFTDFYSGKFDNSVGQTLEMTRNGVCDDYNKGCSAGFHAGSHEYAKGYASSGGHLMVVEIDPIDVVSVPLCSDCQKLRTAKYKVVGVVETIEAPLDDGLNYDYSEDWNEDVEDEYNEGWFAGYHQAKKESGSNSSNLLNN